ncbi:MAG TPA: sigma-70 family RNA polymerase sigma factor [Candidatus Angelobacter sp.]
MDHQQKLEKFERVVLRHMDSAFNLARWFTRNQDDAKDLAQEAFLRAFKAFDRFEGEDGRVWLLTIVRNLYYTSVSHKPQEQTEFDEQIHSAEEFSSSPEVLLLRGAEAQAVRQAIEELPSEFRGPLILRELEGLSYKEIGAIMDVPLGTVMSRLARARDYLKRKLIASGQKTGHEKDGKNAVSGK